MAKVEIIDSLAEEIQKKFKSESHEIVKLLRTLEENPKKGKFICQIQNVAVKELKYKNFRFYFIADNYRIRVLGIEHLKDLLIKFVRMSDKKSQQNVIEEIKDVLRKFDGKGF